MVEECAENLPDRRCSALGRSVRVSRRSIGPNPLGLYGIPLLRSGAAP
ncbi:MAG: hypothetical protein VKK80_02290 [Prochlorothrix sp.]|nr:hypothetical protein [Prochlorothrix sp.]